MPPRTDKNLNARLGQRFRELRDGTGLSQVQLASELQIDAQTISRVEHGQGSSFVTWNLFARYLDIRLAEALDFDRVLGPEAGLDEWTTLWQTMSPQRRDMALHIARAVATRVPAIPDPPVVGVAEGKPPPYPRRKRTKR